VSVLVAIYRARWGVLRLALAAFILWALAADSAGRLARLQLASLPDMDFAAEVAKLRDEGRFGEAVMIADAGLALSTEGSAAHARISVERQKTLDEQSSWARRLKEVGIGALSGQGQSLESLAGAVTADLFIVGDVRDVLIQGARLAVDGEADPVILSLSGIGLATTLAPEIDWGVSLLKIGRKAGALGRRVTDFVVDAARRGDKQALKTLATDVGKLGRQTSPATAMRILKHTDDPADVGRLAAFVERNAAGNAGALALHVTGREGAEMLKAGARAERTFLTAARKGEAGASFLKSSAARVLLRPHPLIGLAKGLYKGNLEALAARIAERIDPYGWIIFPLVAAWVFVEVGLLWRKLARSRTAPSAISPRLAAA
jgi:hypothetical protein